MTATCLSDIPLPENGVIVFDLDDTLYPERDFVRSGFAAVAQRLGGANAACVLQRIVELYEDGQADPFGVVLGESGAALEKRELLDTYRLHEPALSLSPGVRDLLVSLRLRGHALGIATDGRSITQRNKLRALGIDGLVDGVVISEEIGSEKPSPRAFEWFEKRFPNRPCAYIGDNPTKDFVAPNRLGWLTVCVLDSGENIHCQDFAAVPGQALPRYIVERLG